MFADWELIGVPYRVVVGERSLKEGFLELQARTADAATQVKPTDLVTQLQALLLEEKII
jgi:prolyl-tRNA synthetase